MAMTPCAVAAMSPDVRRTSPTGNGQGEHLRIGGNVAVGRTIGRVLRACIDDIPFFVFWSPILLDKLGLCTVPCKHHDY